MRKILKEAIYMKNQWGVFCTEQELNKIEEVIRKKGLEIFEMRKLTMAEKVMYIKDPILFINEPHIIMFNATKWQYKSLVRKLKLNKVF